MRPARLFVITAAMLGIPAATHGQTSSIDRPSDAEIISILGKVDRVKVGQCISQAAKAAKTTALESLRCRPPRHYIGQGDVGIPLNCDVFVELAPRSRDGKPSYYAVFDAPLVQDGSSQRVGLTAIIGPNQDNLTGSMPFAVGQALARAGIEIAEACGAVRVPRTNLKPLFPQKTP